MEISHLVFFYTLDKIINLNNMVRFLENLKKHRANKNFTQQQMSDKIGVSREWYNRLEKNELIPNFEHLQKLAAALSIRMSELLEGSDLLKEFKEALSIDNPKTELDKIEELYNKRLEDKDKIIALKEELIVSSNNQIFELKRTLQIKDGILAQFE